MTVEITNLTSKKIRQNKIKKTIQRAAKKIKLPFSVLSVAFVSGAEIKKLNRKYREKNKVTDVLSFNYRDSGEIVICLEQAEKQAKIAKHSVTKELTMLLIHALLHLKGYNHEKNQKENYAMREQENNLLKHLQEN